MDSQERFDTLLREGEAVPTEGWDFSWFGGRAIEERPPWGYARQMVLRVEAAQAVLDIQTGGGEVLAGVEHPPPVLEATESWPPNLDIARRNLGPLGGRVHQADDDGALPFSNATFDLVVSRHPTVAIWDEISRVLAPGGTYFSQQVGLGSGHELSEAMVGPFEMSQARSPQRAVDSARQAGLEIVDLHTARMGMEFYDIAAVVHFLRKVIWIVPDFTVERYRPQLWKVHQEIEANGVFPTRSTRFLIEARKPDG